MKNIKLSVIIPVFNGEKYLKPLLESIVVQTAPQYEVIVIDDGSTDKSLEILNEYSEKIYNFKIISQENSGVSVARNRGIKEAQGKYFCFCDADDVLSPDYLSAFCQVIDKYSPDMAVCGYEVFYGENTPKPKFSDNFIVEDLSKIAFKRLDNEGLLTQIWNKVYKTDIVKKNCIEFTTGSTYGEDMFFNWKVILASKSVIRTESSLYFYRMIERSASVKYHKGLYESYKREYALLMEFAQMASVFTPHFENEIALNLAKRIPALARMAIRRKKGFLKALNDIKVIVNDDFMVKNLSRLECDAYEGLNPQITALARYAKDKKILRLWFYGFKSELRISIARKNKNFRGIAK